MKKRRMCQWFSLIHRTFSIDSRLHGMLVSLAARRSSIFQSRLQLSIILVCDSFEMSPPFTAWHVTHPNFIQTTFFASPFFNSLVTRVQVTCTNACGLNHTLCAHEHIYVRAARSQCTLTLVVYHFQRDVAHDRLRIVR